MKKVLSLVLFASVFFFSSVYASTQWNCAVRNERGMHWWHYGATRGSAANAALALCNRVSARTANNPKCWVTSCAAPRPYWRCTAYDAPLAGSPRSWYWDSNSRRTAINNALAACRHNSKSGGCHVSRGNCQAS